MGPKGVQPSCGGMVARISGAWGVLSVVLFDPFGAASVRGGVCGPRVRHAHPRLQISSALIGPHASLRFAAGCTVGPHASLRFVASRTAELHDFLRFGAGCPAAELMMRLSAPKGSHYFYSRG